MYRYQTRYVIRFALFAAGLLAAGAVAEPLSAERALREAERWTARAGQPFGERLRGMATGRARTFSDVVYNVFPGTSGSLVTGRITDENGQPLEGATVAARITYRSGWRNVTINTNVVTSTSGIYAVFTPATASSTVRLQASFGAASSGTTTTSTSACSSPSRLDWQSGQYYTSYSGLSIGNSWGNDLVVTAATGATPAVSAFTAAGSGSADGFSLSFTGTGGARYAIEYRESLSEGSWGVCTNLLLSPAGSATLFLPRNPDSRSGFWRVVPGK